MYFLVCSQKFLVIFNEIQKVFRSDIISSPETSFVFHTRMRNRGMNKDSQIVNTLPDFLCSTYQQERERERRAHNGQNRQAEKRSMIFPLDEHLTECNMEIDEINNSHILTSKTNVLQEFRSDGIERLLRPRLEPINDRVIHKTREISAPTISTHTKQIIPTNTENKSLSLLRKTGRIHFSRLSIDHVISSDHT